MGSAVISNCGLYRHSLVRRVSDDNDKALCFIMLNPSTADAHTDDATIRKCKKFCNRFGCGILNVVNLFDYRATDPKDLKKSSKPCSEYNFAIIRAIAITSDIVIAAWGTHGVYGRQNEKVLQMLSDNNIDLHALEITKHGHPKHPLYIHDDTNLKPYPPKKEQTHDK